MPDHSPAGQLQPQNTVIVDSVHTNTAQNLIHITEDRLELRLRDYKEKIEAKQDLFGPLGILITLIVTLSTATFSDTFGIPKHYIKALFVLATAGSLVWVFVAYRSRVSYDLGVKKLIEEIRK